jgi:DNA-directed RNA polymerase specialized sigma24 family protein
MGPADARSRGQALRHDLLQQPTVWMATRASSGVVLRDLAHQCQIRPSIAVSPAHGDRCHRDLAERGRGELFWSAAQISHRAGTSRDWGSLDPLVLLCHRTPTMSETEGELPHNRAASTAGGVGENAIPDRQTPVWRDDFPSTHWTVVLTAATNGAPHAQEAMARLCETYWYPIYGFLRMKGHAPHQAEDLTQEFLGRMVHKDMLAGLTSEGGRFRAFLLTALKRFLANEWNRAHAQKRGSGRILVSFDETAENLYQKEIAVQTTPETLFERAWALAVLTRVFAELRAEYRAAGKEALFARVEGCLPGAHSQTTSGDGGAESSMSEAAIRMAALRLRRRYGQLLRSEIAATVSSRQEIDAEIRYLMEIVGRT